MSLSNNTEIKNPATRFFEWNGDKGHFKYYDKDDKKQVNVQLPFSFITLDVLSKIGGFSKADGSGYWSNEIRDIKKESFVVRTKKGKCHEGNYESVKAANLSGAKYAQSVYIAYKGDDGKLQIGNITMIGSSLGAWIDFRKKNKVYDGSITVRELKEGVNGKTVYQMPVFKLVQRSQEALDQCIILDKELQEYLKAYFVKNGLQTQDEAVLDAAANEANKVADSEFTSKSYREDNIIDGGPPADYFVDDDNEFETPATASSNLSDDLPFVWILLPLALSLMSIV